MLYVLAKSGAEVERWRRKAGLPRTHVHYLSSERLTRGYLIHQHEIIRLPGFEGRRGRAAVERAVQPALVPPGIQHIPVVS